MLVRCPVGTLDVSHHSAKSLTSDSDHVVILGLSDFFGSVIIFVSPIAVVALPPPGDQIVPVRLPELRKVLRGSPSLSPGVCFKGVPSRLAPYVHHCDGGAAYFLASISFSLSLSSSRCFTDALHAFAFSCDTVR